MFSSEMWGCLKQHAVIMISKGPHLRDQPAEWRTSLTNELLNISPSLSCLWSLLPLLFLSFIHSFSLLFAFFGLLFLQTFYLCSVYHFLLQFCPFVSHVSSPLMCCSDPLKQCGLVFRHTVSQLQHPVQTSSSVYT